jgi:M6 family metalloprotease-like protein
MPPRITTDNTEEYYSFGKRGTVPESQQMAWPALDNLDARPNFDFSKFDLDGNGKIDSLVIIHSGYGAETTTTDCFGRDFNNRIWAHAFSSSSKDAWISKDGSIRVSGYTIASALDSDCGAVPAKIGLTVHEYMHTLGLDDLYDGVDALAASGVGAFDIMAYPYGQNDDADNPGHLSVYR